MKCSIYLSLICIWKTTNLILQPLLPDVDMLIRYWFVELYYVMRGLGGTMMAPVRCVQYHHLGDGWYQIRTQYYKRLTPLLGSLTHSRVNHGSLNTLRPSHNERHFADDIFKCIFLNENVLISIKLSLKFVPKGPINYIPELVQIMAWRRPGDKPLSETMMVRLLTYTCVTRPQWVNDILAQCKSMIIMPFLTPFEPHFNNTVVL